MTIYAIVNNLIPDKQSAGASSPIWTLLSPSAILQGGNPYFVPDFDTSFEARLALAVKIGKLGKSIAPRFAYRYIEAVAPAVVIVAACRLRSLMEERLPWTSALSYDRSLALGKFHHMDDGVISDCGCGMILESDGGACKESLGLCSPSIPLDEIIAAISRDNTLKTGDIILTRLAGEGPEVRPGMKLRLIMEGEDSLRFNIR